VDARLFPVEGGLLATAGLSTDLLASELIVASGLETCGNILNDIRAGRLSASLVELMACTGGCINGPAMADLEGGIYTARQKILAYLRRRPAYDALPREDWPDLSRGYTDKRQPVPEFSEEQIQDVLRRVNKYTPEDELNCGACGYPSCREKAIATLRGMAEVTMCIPYMRSGPNPCARSSWTSPPTPSSSWTTTWSFRTCPRRRNACSAVRSRMSRAGTSRASFRCMTISCP
jgi:hypothetical protein